MSAPIGEKRKRIRIEQQVTVPDGQGGHTLSYALRAVVAAHERPVTGTEAQRLGQLTAISTSVWEIWYRDDVSVKDRVRFKARICQIVSTQDPNDDRVELYLFTTEVAA